MEGIRILEKNADMIIIQIKMKGKELVVAQMNKEFGKETAHTIEIEGRKFAWKGPFGVWWEGRKMSEGAVSNE